MNPTILRRVTALALAATMSLAARGHAEEQAPSPSPEIQRFVALVGQFDGSGTLSMGGKSAPVTFHHDIHAFALGFGVQIDEQFDSEMTGHYEAVNIVGFDPNTGRMHLYTVDNFADAHDHAGRWVNDHTLKLQHVGTVEGKRYVENLGLEITSPDSYTLTLRATLGGKAYQAGDVTMHRVKTASR